MNARATIGIAALLAASGLASASTSLFFADLSGLNEVPPNNS